MGFGFMFLGTFFFWSLKIGNFDVLPDFIGYLILIHGMNCATKYCKNFKTARTAAYIGAVFSAAIFLMQALELLGVSYSGTPLEYYLSTANQTLRILFVMLLLLAIFGLSKETGAEKTEKRSLISLITVPVFWVGYIVIGVLNYFNVVTDPKVLSAAMLCEIIYVALTAVAAFSAYMWICVEGDENMEKKNDMRTPMDFFDRRREKDDEEKRAASAKAAGKTVSQMYGVKKKKKKGR